MLLVMQRTPSTPDFPTKVGGIASYGLLPDEAALKILPAGDYVIYEATKTEVKKGVAPSSWKFLREYKGSA